MSAPFSPSLPSRAEFGMEHYSYPPLPSQQRRLWTGTTRTIRPTEGETGATFRARVDLIVASLDPCGIIEVTVDEEIRAGVVVQAIVHVTRSPEPVTVSPDDLRVAGGRPSTPRGARGGSSRGH